MFTPMATSSVESSIEESPSSSQNNIRISILVNGCNVEMLKALIVAAETAGLYVVPVAFGPDKMSGRTFVVSGKSFLVHGPPTWKCALKFASKENPNLIVVDHSTTKAVIANAELYCKVGVPFVMLFHGADKNLLRRTIESSQVYALITQEIGKQVVAFVATIGIVAERFPGVFSGYSLEAVESHQAGKVGACGTAKAMISCFNKLGVPFEVDEIQMVRDTTVQVQKLRIPPDDLCDHAFHVYFLQSPDKTVSFVFQHNICGRSIYAEGFIDAVTFLAKKIKSMNEKRVYTMVDLLREGHVR